MCVARAALEVGALSRGEHVRATLVLGRDAAAAGKVLAQGRSQVIRATAKLGCLTFTALLIGSLQKDGNELCIRDMNQSFMIPPNLGVVDIVGTTAMLGPQATAFSIRT